MLIGSRQYGPNLFQLHGSFQKIWKKILQKNQRKNPTRLLVLSFKIFLTEETEESNVLVLMASGYLSILIHFELFISPEKIIIPSNTQRIHLCTH